MIKNYKPTTNLDTRTYVTTKVVLEETDSIEQFWDQKWGMPTNFVPQKHARTLNANANPKVNKYWFYLCKHEWEVRKQFMIQD